MTWLTNLTGFIAPFFIIMSPIISYGDQILSMHRNKSSAGFSLDIPLIMLVASFFRYAMACALRAVLCRQLGSVLRLHIQIHLLTNPVCV